MGGNDVQKQVCGLNQPKLILSKNVNEKIYQFWGGRKFVICYLRIGQKGWQYSDLLKNLGVFLRSNLKGDKLSSLSGIEQPDQS